MGIVRRRLSNAATWERLTTTYFALSRSARVPYHGYSVLEGSRVKLGIIVLSHCFLCAVESEIIEQGEMDECQPLSNTNILNYIYQFEKADGPYSYAKATRTIQVNQMPLNSSQKPYQRCGTSLYRLHYLYQPNIQCLGRSPSGINCSNSVKLGMPAGPGSNCV